MRGSKWSEKQHRSAEHRLLDHEHCGYCCQPLSSVDCAVVSSSTVDFRIQSAFFLFFSRSCLVWSNVDQYIGAIMGSPAGTDLTTLPFIVQVCCWLAQPRDTIDGIVIVWMRRARCATRRLHTRRPPEPRCRLFTPCCRSCFPRALASPDAVWSTVRSVREQILCMMRVCVVPSPGTTFRCEPAKFP